MELTKRQDIAGELAALGYYAFIADIYGEKLCDNAEAGQNLVIIKRIIRNIKQEFH
jgi:dienelactone hydrolase